ncbi:YhcN/YlaJ family sporulation lipoprotein [Lentibacillus sediminis]|uniref:YhcN/YlaJ family sporulation lipoprotein n=1 Tax=Lentibacillus sediminis TaxID=1940529 RepID=UPI000C1B9342|nr:YhcN/YlaJ family sporulation lipoprotein [Lentibacillus sediminis]
MKTKLFTAIGLSGLLLISGCGGDNNAGEQGIGINEKLNPNNEMEQPANEELNEQLGYVRFSRDEVNNTQEDHAMTMDRTEVAQMITRTILRNEGFEEVATLVTDQEVLIAYERNGELDTENAADIASKTAMSVVPRYYNIHVSDNASLMEDIQSLHNSRTDNRNYDNTIDQIIKQMNQPAE